MEKQSAGLLMFCRSDREPEVFLVHPGGPFWAKKDEGAWTIPKGEPAEGEELLHAAQREFSEETGFDAHGPFHELGAIIQAGGKKVTVWLRGGLRSRETEEQFVRHRMAPTVKANHPYPRGRSRGLFPLCSFCGSTLMTIVR